MATSRRACLACASDRDAETSSASRLAAAALLRCLCTYSMPGTAPGRCVARWHSHSWVGPDVRCLHLNFFFHTLEGWMQADASKEASAQLHTCRTCGKLQHGDDGDGDNDDGTLSTQSLLLSPVAWFVC